MSGPGPRAAGAKSTTSGPSARRVLVTGARGFIGRELADVLQASGASVIGTTRGPSGACMSRITGRRVELQHLDPASEPSVRELLGAARPDVVFHLSGQARPGRAASDPAGTLEANTRAVWLLLETIRTLTPHTVLVIAATTEQGPDRFGDRHPYFVSKAAAELICASYAATYGVRVAIARLSHVYGPDEDQDRLVTAIVAASVAGGSLQLRDPQRRFDLLFIEDATAGLAAVSDRARAGGPLAYNLSTGESVTGEEVAALVGRLVDGDHLAPEPTALVGVRRPAGRPTGWRPRVPLVAGLAATIAWHRSRVGEGLHAGV